MSQSFKKDALTDTLFRIAPYTNLGPNFLRTVVIDSLPQASLIRWKDACRGGSKLFHVPRRKNPRRLVFDYHLHRAFPFIRSGLRRLLPEDIAKDPRIFIANKVRKCVVELPCSGFAFGDHLKDTVDCSQDRGREPTDSQPEKREAGSVPWQ